MFVCLFVCFFFFFFFDYCFVWFWLGRFLWWCFLCILSFFCSGGNRYPVMMCNRIDNCIKRYLPSDKMQTSYVPTLPSLSDRRLFVYPSGRRPRLGQWGLVKRQPLLRITYNPSIMADIHRPPSLPAVQVTNLSYKFPDCSTALDNVNLTLPKGSCTVLIGGIYPSNLFHKPSQP
jgi:hypothetical protein